MRAEPLGGRGQAQPRLYAIYSGKATIKKGRARRVGSSELLGRRNAFAECVNEALGEQFGIKVPS